MGADRHRIRSYLEELNRQTYQERLVSIETFISDNHYLGRSFRQGKAVYPVWHEKLDEIFLDDERYIVAFTGAIGTGKTSMAIVSLLYVMYKLLLLKDPWGYFELASGGKMAITFFNLTKNLSESRGFSYMQSYMMASPWFIERGNISGRQELQINFPLFSYALASPYSRGFGTVGENVIAGIMDEVDSPTESKGSRERVLKAYEATVRRFESRFVKEGRCLGRLFLVASKQDEVSFLQPFIAEMQNSNRVYVVDIPIWEAKPDAYYCGEKFLVSAGDAYHAPTIVETEEQLQNAAKESLRVIEVPVEYRTDFERDIVGALRDIAGVSVTGTRSLKLFSSEKFINECYDGTREDPVSQLTITIGLQDNLELIQLLDLAKIRLPRNTPRFIHTDIAFTGDALGIAMSGVAGYVDADIEQADGQFQKQRVPLIETDFVMRIKARAGDEIPQHKIRKLVLDLKTAGFNIAKYTSDLRLASTDTLQILKQAGIKAEYFSVDTDIKPYFDFRNLVYEHRWICYHNGYLHFELANLEVDSKRKKVDHPSKVSDVIVLKTGEVRETVLEGSKDCSDAVCGSVINALWSDEVPMDVEAMKKLIRRVTTSKEPEKDKYWNLTDAGGKQVVGVQNTSQDIKKFAGLLKRRRR